MVVCTMTGEVLPAEKSGRRLPLSCWRTPRPSCQYTLPAWCS